MDKASHCLQSKRGPSSAIPYRNRTQSLAFAAGLILLFTLPLTILAAPQDALEAARLSPTLYFPSAEAESASLDKLHLQVAPAVAKLATASPRNLLTQLDTAETLIAAVQTHAAYLKIRTLEDTRDQLAKEHRDAVAADQSVLETAINARLRRVPPSQIDALGRYAFLAHSASRDAAHALSPDAERYRETVTAPSIGSLGDAYDRIDSRLTRPKGTASLDTTTRRAALATWADAYDKAAPEEATLLAAMVELQNRDAVAQGYINAADRKYQSLGLSEAQVNHILQAVQKEAPAFRRYQQVLADHASARLNVTPVLSTEVDLATSPGDPIPLARAQDLILSALQPLGPDYTGRFASLLNPANGRLDLSGGPHRANAGTSISAFNAPTALYYSGYDGSLRDISKIAHEGGHAIHRELMNAAAIPIYARSGPNYLFEGFAIFNELLLLDYAAHTAPTSAARQYALERLLSKISLELFVSAEETSFEHDLYTAAIGQPLLDRSKIDALYQSSILPFEIWPTSDIGQSRGWMRKSLLFEDPLYLVNYLYASVIAVALYEKSHTDPGFASKYNALLRRGFDADPQTLLASIGIHLDDPALVQPAARLLTEKTAELQTLYLQAAK